MLSTRFLIRLSRALPLAATLVAVFALSPARADVAADVSSELVSQGINPVSVTVETPAAASAALDENTTQTLAFDDYKPYLSPDYTAPRPILRVLVDEPASNPLAGVLIPPGFTRPVATAGAPILAVWELAVFNAAKHAVAKGSLIVGFEFDIRTSWLTTLDRTLKPLPIGDAFPPEQPHDPKLPIATVEQQTRRELPAWANAADVSVTEDPAGERVITASLALPAPLFATHDVFAIREALNHTQAMLVADGGNIGRLILRITDPVNHDPLYVSADDPSWGFHSAWTSPIVSGLIGIPHQVAATAAPSQVAGASPPGLP